MRTAQKLISIGVLTIIVVSGSLFAQDKAKTGKKTYVGTITDTICGTKHMMKGMTDAECAKMCVDHGADYALAVGSKIYTLRGKKEDIGKFAGTKVRITGTTAGDTITADSIAAAGTAK